MSDALPFPKSDINRPIGERFEAIARRFPQRVAVRHGSSALTYAALDTAANRVRHALLANADSAQRPVALLFGHDLPVTTALIGALKAGTPYSVLDPGHPVPRNRAVLADLDASLLLTDTPHLSAAHVVADGRCPVIDVTQLDAGTMPDSAEPVSPNAIAGIYYTSGTTGKPKGVVRTHQFILHRIWLETAQYAIRPDDRFSLMHGFNYGASVTDTFNALLNGATLHLYDFRSLGLAPLARWLRDNGVTFFHAPSAVFRQFVASLTPADTFPALRQITPSGRLYRRDVASMRRHVAAQCVLIQRLASTETGMITLLELTADTALDGDVVPVGYPVADKTIRLLDPDGQPVGPGEIGEIEVESRYLAAGYWRRPELTAHAFRPNPDIPGLVRYRLGDMGRFRPDGCLELLGRKDGQVKIRGFRVELSAVEAALLDLPHVAAAAVVARDDPAGDKRLVAYVVFDSAARALADLRQTLAANLPDYMVPAAWVVLPALPLTDRGKLDVDALPDPGRRRPALPHAPAAPRNSAETTLAALWSHALALQPVGVTDNVFELGAQSLQAAQVAAEAAHAFGRDIPLLMVYDYPTIAAFCRELERAERPGGAVDERTLAEALNLLGY